MEPEGDLRPELLAPAGDWEALRAAVANGADAVYFGLSKYSARQRATNFTPDELPQVVAYLHGHNVRGYVTFNTLIYSDELPQAAEWAGRIAASGADAVIVQDLGLARLIHRLAPTLPIHASTQMSLTDARGIEFVRGLGIERVILARELSLAEIRRIRDATPMPLEVFVHGALCMSYSGQCLTSEALWGRSANRGLCGQACRLPYRLLVDGRPHDLGDKAYLLSTKDLAAYDRIADLVGLGIAGFKIEGRLKSAHYVAAATQVYRAALDAACQGRRFSLAPDRVLSLAQSYSRGFTHGFLDGANHQDLVHGLFPKSRGVRVGTIVAKAGRGVMIEADRQASRGKTLADLLKPGDGVVFDDGRPAEDEQGGRVFSVEPVKGRRRFLVTFGEGDLNLAAVVVGSAVWKTDDPRLKREWEKSWARETVVRRAPVSAKVWACAGQPLRVRFADAAGNEAEVASEAPLEEARTRPLTRDLLREQLGRLGDTPFELAGIEIIGDGGPAASAPVMAPKSVLNDLRRRAAQMLLESRDRRTRHAVAEPDALDAIRREMGATGPVGATGGLSASAASPPQLYVLARTLNQLEALLDWRPAGGLARPAMLYCDFQDTRLYADAVAHCRAAGLPVGLATLRISKPNDDEFLQRVADCRPDAVLVRHVSGLAFLRQAAPDLRLVGDFSLNAANEISSAVLAEAGLARLAPSLDLNMKQFAAEAGQWTPVRLEPIIHLHVPMMHMEHCVPAAHLSKGRDAAACGRPCSRRIDLADRVGAEHPLVTDARCRSTLYSAHVQSAVEYLPEMLRLGVRHFRIELLREGPKPAVAITELYARVLAGRLDPAEALVQLEKLVPAGVKRGTWDFD